MSKYVINNPDNEFTDFLGNTFKIGDDIVMCNYNNTMHRYAVVKECKSTLKLIHKGGIYDTLINKCYLHTRVIKVDKLV